MGRSNLNRLIDSFKEPVVHNTTKSNGVTETQYTVLEQAFALFNTECFNSELSPVLITFQRGKKTLGYYSPDRLDSRLGAVAIPEIALNIGTFNMRTDKQIFSTLLHEMVHHWQQIAPDIKRSKGGYHDKIWSAKMKAVGLFPSHTGEPDGKETGAKMTHYIIENGVFETLFNTFKDRGLTINWQSKEGTADKPKKCPLKIKYTCPSCEANAWGKPELSLLCGECSSEDELIIMPPSE